MSSSGRIFATTPLLPWRPASLSPTWSLAARRDVDLDHLVDGHGQVVALLDVLLLARGVGAELVFHRFVEQLEAVLLLSRAWRRRRTRAPRTTPCDAASAWRGRCPAFPGSRRGACALRPCASFSRRTNTRVPMILPEAGGNAQRGVLDVLGLLAEDDLQQALLGGQLLLALGRDLADQDVALADNGGRPKDAPRGKYCRQ